NLCGGSPPSEGNPGVVETQFGDYYRIAGPPVPVSFEFGPVCTFTSVHEERPPEAGRRPRNVLIDKAPIGLRPCIHLHRVGARVHRRGDDAWRRSDSREV